MTIDDDLILPIVSGITAIILTLSTFYISIDTYEEEATVLSDKIASLYSQLELTEKELRYYKSLDHSITNLGASPKQVIDILYASDKYQLDPEKLAALIRSESSFKDRVHAEEGVIGLCGINTKVNPNLPHNPYNDTGNILCSAYLLRVYLDTYKTYPKAIKRYKGFSKLGEMQAEQVMRIYKDMQ